MKNIISLFTLSLFAVLLLSGFMLNNTDDHKGKELFLKYKCEKCHSVSIAGIEAKVTKGKTAGGDLIDLDKEKKDWYISYIKKEVKKDDTAHLVPFKGTDEELQALVDWLLEQKVK